VDGGVSYRVNLNLNLNLLTTWKFFPEYSIPGKIAKNLPTDSFLVPVFEKKGFFFFFFWEHSTEFQSRGI